MGQIIERKVRNYYGADADKASILAGGKSIGDLYFATDTKAVYRWDGGAWVWGAPDLSVTVAMLAADAKGKFETQLLHIQDQKNSGIDGDGILSGAWRTRVLNVVLTNEIPGSSLASNQITLPAGIYFVMASAGCYGPERHQAKLYNITDAADILIGTSEYNNAAVYGIQTRSFVTGRFTLSAAKVIELRHQVQVNATGGVASNWGVVEIYSDVKIWKM